ncbi:MAG TPA: winged helix-turn-helix domain-containing protein [Candidatus Merdivicinus intestinavium]|nr:winged helix-turn-helix domain-containing protein [Candidatus Merdivicinus intestinavium]
MEERNTVHIRMLGEFSIQWGDKRVSDADGRARKVWFLIEYLIANRQKSFSLEQLSEAVWSDSEDSDNPKNALKNLVYRARTLLKALSGEMEFIVYSNNSYSWNQAIPCAVDAEEFERLCAKGEEPGLDAGRRMQAYRRAVELYQGEFLPKSACLGWVVTKSAYYASLYSRAVEQAVRMLGESGRHSEVVEVCEMAVVQSPYEENIHYALLKALIATGQRRKAIAHYERLAEFFYESLGVTLSSEVRALYKEMTTGMEALEADMDSIEQDLRETDMPQHAFYCDYEIFRQMYRLQARSIARTGQSVHIALLTLRNLKGETPDANLIQSAMTQLRDVTLASLRKGDLVSVYSTNQLVLMLPMTTYENGQKVLRRILAAFAKKRRKYDCYVDTKLREITPSAY